MIPTCPSLSPQIFAIYVKGCCEMARVRDNPSIAPPLAVIVGQQESASYQTQFVPEFNDHPLIEPLPPIWPLEHVTELLSHYPEYSEKYRELPAEIRLH